MSARESRAPAPQQHREARAGDLAPRARSRGCRAPAPRSQCGLRRRSRTARGSPTRRTSRLSAALVPTGTLACGRFGTVEQEPRALLLERLELGVELLDPLRALRGWPRRRPSRPGRAASRARPPRRRCSAARFSVSTSGMQRAAARRRARPARSRQRVRLQAAVLQAGADAVGDDRGRMRDRACGSDSWQPHA